MRGIAIRRSPRSRLTLRRYSGAASSANVLRLSAPVPFRGAWAYFVYQSESFAKLRNRVRFNARLIRDTQHRAAFQGTLVRRCCSGFRPGSCGRDSCRLTEFTFIRERSAKPQSRMAN